MIYLLIIILLFTPYLQAKCHCYEVAETVTVSVVEKPIEVAATAPLPQEVAVPAQHQQLVPVIVPHVEEPEPEKVHYIPVQLPDPEEPANLKAQAIRAGLLCAATLAVFFGIRYALSLDGIEQAVRNLQRNHGHAE
jgi:hypothetical protein